MPSIRSAAPCHRERKKGRDACIERASLTEPATSMGVRSATRGGLPAHAILQPGERNDEERREHHTKQRVDPHERNVECAEAETDPKDAERAVSFQVNAPVAVNPTVTA